MSTQVFVRLCCIQIARLAVAAMTVIVSDVAIMSFQR